MYKSRRRPVLFVVEFLSETFYSRNCVSNIQGPVLVGTTLSFSLLRILRSESFISYSCSRPPRIALLSINLRALTLLLRGCLLKILFLSRTFFIWVRSVFARFIPAFLHLITGENLSLVLNRRILIVVFIHQVVSYFLIASLPQRPLILL